MTYHPRLVNPPRLGGNPRRGLARIVLASHVCIHLDGKLHNIHALAIPMFEHHTGENMFLLVSCFLDVVCPHWRMQLLGIGSDGASSMVGHLQGVVTQLVNASPHSVYRVWCGLHQLDLQYATHEQDRYPFYTLKAIF